MRPAAILASALCALAACSKSGAPQLKPGEAGLHLKLISDVSDQLGSIAVEIRQGAALIDAQTINPGPLTMPGQPARLGGDAYFTLRPGDYDVAAKPFDKQGAPSKICTAATGKATAVVGKTNEIVLTLFCSDQGTGGIDVVVTTDHPPVITGLAFDPSKITTTCAPIGISVTAKDADNDVLTYAWQVVTKQGQGDPQAQSYRLQPSGATAKFVSATEGDYELRVDVSDKSQHTVGLSFPVHVGAGSDATCLGGVPRVPPGTPVQSALRSPAAMFVNVAGKPAGPLSTSVKASTPLTFAVRGDHAIAGGIIANGQVSFSFRTTGGVDVVCKWKGDAPTAAPQSEDELNRGRLLRFVGCSDGLPASARRTAISFTLSVSPAAGYPVTVRTPITDDGHCSDDLELLSAAQTRAMHDGFNWQTQSPVADRNPDGKPTLFYGWVYVRNNPKLLGKDALALRQLLIHTLQRPLFTAELDKFSGKCGAITNAGDGRGTFVPVVLPGNTFNKLLDVAQGRQDVGTSEKIIFEAVILRDDVPAEARNANGSIKLEALAQAGFRYLPDLSAADRAIPWNELQFNAGVAAAIEGAIEWLAGAVRDFVREITDVLADLDATFGAGRVNLNLFVGAISGDTAFPANTPMIRGWGPTAGTLLGAQGMTVSILQSFIGTPIPATSRGQTDDFGHVLVTPIRNAGPIGSGICLTLEARAGLVTDFLLATEVCDLRAFNPATATTTEFLLNDFSADRTLAVNIESTRLAGLYQAADVFKYMGDLAGFHPKRARILSGYWASTFTTSSGGFKRLFTPCMNYKNTVSDTLLGGAVVGSLIASLVVPDPILVLATTVFASVIANTDIVMPEESALPTDRGVMSHEYGHYEFCSMLFEQNEFAVDHLVWTTIIHGDDQSLPARYVNEAMADVFSGQVAGGANYRWLGSGIFGGHYCVPGIPCFDENFNGVATGTGGNESIGRVASMIHDMIDGHGARGSLLPNDADLWTPDGSGTLMLSPTGYSNIDPSLERVALNADALRSFAHHLSTGLLPFAIGPSITDQGIYSSLDATMREGGVNWCDRCRLMALHSPGHSPTNVRQLFETCLADPTIVAAAGAPPEPSARLDANSCTPCPAGSVSNDDGVCTACAGDVHGNRCDVCPADVVLDGNTTDLTNHVFDTTQTFPGDICPDVFVVEVRNPTALFTRTGDVGQIFGQVFPSPLNQATCEQPFQLQLSHDAHGVFTPDGNLDQRGRWECANPSVPMCVRGCQNLPTRTWLQPDVNGDTLRFSTPAVPGNRFLFSADRTPG